MCAVVNHDSCVVASITRLVYVVRFIDAETGETLPIGKFSAKPIVSILYQWLS